MTALFERGEINVLVGTAALLGEGWDAPSLDTLVPDNPNKPYDIKEAIHKIVDDNEFMELQPEHARNVVIGL